MWRKFSRSHEAAQVDTHHDTCSTREIMPATVLYEDLLLPEKKLNWSCEAEAPHLKLIYYKISVNEKSTLWIEFGSTPVRLKKLALVYPRIRDSFDKETLFSDFLKWLVKSVWITYDNIFNPQLIHCWAMFCSFSRFHFKKHVFLRFS